MTRPLYCRIADWLAWGVIALPLTALIVSGLTGGWTIDELGRACHQLVVEAAAVGLGLTLVAAFLSWLGGEFSSNHVSVLPPREGG